MSPDSAVTKFSPLLMHIMGAPGDLTDATPSLGAGHRLGELNSLQSWEVPPH